MPVQLWQASAGLSLWVSYLKLSDTQIGLLGALSANAISAAVGALLGGFLADKVGRKAVYTNSMLVYALGICLVLFGVNFPMLLSGYIIIGLSVGADITASWTIIAENAPKKNRVQALRRSTSRLGRGRCRCTAPLRTGR